MTALPASRITRRIVTAFAVFALTACCGGGSSRSSPPTTRTVTPPKAHPNGAACRTKSKNECSSCCAGCCKGGFGVSSGTYAAATGCTCTE